jgi:hypothetical protein
MASPKLGARTRTVLAALALGSIGLASGCYSTTPHRAQVASNVAPRDCTTAIRDVFARSGFIQLPTPPRMSMLFTARLEGPYSSFLRSGTGVGVTIDPARAAAGACDVTIEALSPDVSCPYANMASVCNNGTARVAMDPVTGSTLLASPQADVIGAPVCPTTALMCPLSYAPGADNDAAVDELARRVQVALGPSATVN